MIKVFEKNETNFRHNKNVMNDSISCDITEEINGTYEIDGEFPLNDDKGISPLLVPGNIISVPSWDSRPDQLFVIRRAKPKLGNGNIVTYYAQHIAIAKLDNNIVLDTYIQGKTRQQAVGQILNSTINKHHFIVGYKDTNKAINNLRIVRYSALEAIKGNKENTVINRYGGEVSFNNFEINVFDRLGKNKGLRATYAKNITGAEATFEDLDLITEIIPVGSDGLMLPEKSIRASNFDANNPFTRVIEFSDIGIVEPETDENGKVTNADEVVTQEQAYEKLRQACRDKFNKEHVNEISFNLTLDLVELADCLNFEGNDYSSIDDRVSIGDDIGVYLKPLGITQTARIYKIVRDAITGRLKSVEVGSKKSNIVDTINKTDSKIDDTKTELKQDVKEAKEKAEKDTNALQVVMEKRDSEIELSVSNEAEQRKTSIEVLDGKISSNVTAINELDGKTEKLSSSIEQTADEIKTCVKKDKFGSEIQQHFDEITATINDGTSHNVIFNANGLTVDNGALVVKNEDGTKIVWIKNGCLCVNDIDIDYHAFSDESSCIYTSLLNAREINVGSATVTAGKIKLGNYSDLTINGENLYSFVQSVIDDNK